ncbi:RNA polymerase II mediator complex subunit MED8 KNAG_0A03640 [Huiozyma naganishii CBS 8797]|uniref:Mediator of RNA polymerase II transcription subunit 8 n=1 Tax=Huiozyma naganishii (strain ATCC MYA-139 / BCRC 22969 / CBS 8797 / KCTC 17520 / NBRC 10181 / NCYC 3082 / Yp74L-3) TaxID=1071383 RepID=J7QZV8_HUIN7|nr:hypothetical protein KNAG_0A03640 [Kazachstania naganishii CBS 8797]CCK68045.1 hypothetical protein KNAG_0A03640 [Kazachstania naganishii CBS 8797]
MSQEPVQSHPKANDLAPPDGIEPDFSGVPTQALDAVRMRVAQLTHSLRRVRDDLSKSELPQWYSLQAQLNVTLSQLMSVTSTLEHYYETLDSTVIYPLPNFPTTSHENLLTTLLRKKFPPDVEEWIKVSKETFDIPSNTLSSEETRKILQNDINITKWALGIFAEQFEKQNFKENNDDNMIIDSQESSINNYKPSRPFEADDILKYMYCGQIPTTSSDDVNQ